MSDHATLKTLLVRVLEGEGPDRELEGEIEACLTSRVTHPSAPGWTFEPQDTEWKLARLAGSPFISRARRPAPPYTTSLDAALMLVPEGWRAYTADWSIPGVYSWTLRGPCREYVTNADGSDETGDDWFRTARAATPARALIAACIKARMEAQPLSNP